MKVSPKVGHVLQGYFRVEQFRSTGNKATGIQPTLSGRLTPSPPRTDLLPAHMWGGQRTQASVESVRSTSARPVTGKDARDGRATQARARNRTILELPRADTRDAAAEWAGDQSVISAHVISGNLEPYLPGTLQRHLGIRHELLPLIDSQYPFQFTSASQPRTAISK